MQLNDTIEIWYFNSKDEERKRDLGLACGYMKVENGALVENRGRETEFSYLRSNTRSID